MATACVTVELRHDETHSNIGGPARGYFVARFSNIPMAVMVFVLIFALQATSTECRTLTLR